MAFYQTSRSLPRRFRLVLLSFLQAAGLPFADVLPETRIEQAFEEEGWACDSPGDAPDKDERVYTPAITLWALLSQALFKEEERSCLAAVARVVVLLVALGKKKPLAKGDHLVVWRRPAKPDWMDQETYDHIPRSIEVREVEVRVDQPGFRTDSFVVVTTLVEAQKYTAADIGELYHKRWLAELDIRASKKTLGMDLLRCKSPKMVRTEIWTCLLAYNLIRKAILQAADEGGLMPREISFTATKQKITASWDSLPLLNRFDNARMILLIEVHLENLTSHRVGNRPDRVEPRAIKRRPRPQRLLTMPREEARARLLNGEELYKKQK